MHWRCDSECQRLWFFATPGKKIREQFSESRVFFVPMDAHVLWNGCGLRQGCATAGGRTNISDQPALRVRCSVFHLDSIHQHFRKINTLRTCRNL